MLRCSNAGAEWPCGGLFRCDLESSESGAERKIRKKQNSFDVDYMTLEKSAHSLEGTGTALCSWDRLGTRRNFGNGPIPDLNAFVQALETWDYQHLPRLEHISLWQRIRQLFSYRDPFENIHGPYR